MSFYCITTVLQAQANWRPKYWDPQDLCDLMLAMVCSSSWNIVGIQWWKRSREEMPQCLGCKESKEMAVLRPETGRNEDVKSSCGS